MDFQKEVAVVFKIRSRNLNLRSKIYFLVPVKFAVFGFPLCAHFFSDI